MQANLTFGALRHQRPRNARFLAVRLTAVAALAFVAGMTFTAGPAAAAQGGGSGEVAISSDWKQWHKVTLTLDGPWARESDDQPNPFTDYRLTVTFRHESGSPQYVVPGYFAADGDAANSSADAGTKWRAHLSPDKTGKWTYKVSFVKGKQVAVEETTPAEPVAGCDGTGGTFVIGPTDKTGRGFRAKGRLQYVGGHHLRFAGNGEYFLKAGADAPENFLAYREFDGDFKSDGHKDNLVKDWKPHIQDWKSGDPTWQGGRGKGIIGAVNYLAAKGLNAMSFLTMNIRGDDQNVFPYVAYDDYTHLDVSRLDQWEIVFAHAQQQGLYLHFKTQEMENQALLDGGQAGPLRKLYYRELIARFGHHLALNWNMGEEVGPWGNNPFQDTPERLAMAEYFFQHDPYHHHVVIHNGKPFDFGYKLPQNDLVCEDFRSRDKSWDYCRIALDFFREHEIPFWEMTNADALIGNAKNDNSRYCLAKPGSVYLVYLPTGGTAEIDLNGVSGTFTVQWFDPRRSGPLQQGSVTKVSGGGKTALGTPPKDASDDWLIVITR